MREEKSILHDIYESNIAMELISLGARMQVLESETSLSRRKLLKLYKELRGCPPPKGMLPFSEDWFMVWQQNIHSSLFYNIWLYLQKTERCRPIEATLKAYRLYLEQCPGKDGTKPILGMTRAWTLLRFVDCGIIQYKACSLCGGGFVVTKEVAKGQFVCSLCSPPSRAVKRYAIPANSRETSIAF